MARGIDVRIVADKASDPPGYGFAPFLIRSELIKSGKYKTLRDIIADETVRARLAGVGVVVHGSGAAEFGTFMADEYRRWDTVRAAAGIEPQ